MEKKLIVFLMSILVVLPLFVFAGDCELKGVESFTLENCTHQEISDYCNIYGCNSSQLEGLDDEDRGQVVGMIFNYNNINNEELIYGSNKKYIDITTPEFVTFYNSAPFSFQREIFSSLSDYDGELTKEFFQAINTQENMDNFWENYRFGDVTEFMRGLSWSERLNAAESYLFNEEVTLGLGEMEPQLVLELLQRKGYDIESLDYEIGSNISILDGFLIMENTSIDLDSLNYLSSLSLDSSNNVNIDNNVFTNTRRINISDGLKTMQGDLITTENYKVINSHNFSEKEGIISMRYAEKFLVGNTTTEDYAYVFENLGESFINLTGNDMNSGFIRSERNDSVYYFENESINITLDRGDSFDFTKRNGKYDVMLNSSSAIVSDSIPLIAKIKITPGSRYSYIGKKYDDFSVFIPSNARTFTLFIKTLEMEGFPSLQDDFGVIDFLSNSANLNGIFEYEKKAESPLFLNAINAVKNSSCRMVMDKEMAVANLTFDSEEIELSNEGIQIFYEDFYTYKFSSITHSNAFSAIQSNITFEGKRMERDGPNKLLMYQKDSDAGKSRLDELKEWFKWLQ